MDEGSTQGDRQKFEIREQRHSSEPAVDLMTWFGDGNKVSIVVYRQNLEKLRDTINEFLEGE